VLQLLISDVPGDKPADIGSGLLVPDGASGMGSDLAVWKGVHTEIIASSSIAQQAVAVAAEAKGFTVRQASGELYGEMPDVIERVSKRLLSANSLPGVYIWGGEPTIELPSNPGRGGRNQHLALAMSAVAAQKGNMSILVCGTDGTDGPTGDAGGLVSERTQKDAQENALDIDDYLAIGGRRFLFVHIRWVDHYWSDRHQCDGSCHCHLGLSQQQLLARFDSCICAKIL